MTTEPEYAYSTNEEDWHLDYETICDKVEEYIHEGDFSYPFYYYRGTTYKKPVSYHFNIDFLLENIEENAWDCYGEYAEDFLSCLSDDDRKELDTVISNWLDSKVTTNCYLVKDVERIEMPQEELKEFLEGVLI